MNKATPEEAIEFIRKSVVSGFVWPLPSTATKGRTLAFKIVQGCSVISSALFFLPLLGGAYANRKDIAVLTSCMVASVSTFQFGFHAAFCLFNYEDIQNVIQEMMDCVKNASTLERKIFQKYVNQCRVLYFGAIIWIYLCVLSYVASPFLLNQKFPMKSEYPFSTDSLHAWLIVYIHQNICAVQCGAALSHSAYGALFIWFSAARFECLTLELKEISNAPMLIDCIKKQMHLRRYAQQVVSCFRLSIICAAVLFTMSFTVCCIGFLLKQPMIGKVQNMFGFFTILLEMYMYAWPADHLKDMSMFVPQGVYESEWYNRAVSMKKDIVCMLTYQEPVTISIRGIMPELTLRYYCTVRDRRTRKEVFTVSDDIFGAGLSSFLTVLAHRKQRRTASTGAENVIRYVSTLRGFLVRHSSRSGESGDCLDMFTLVRKAIMSRWSPASPLREACIAGNPREVDTQVYCTVPEHSSGQCMTSSTVPNCADLFPCTLYLLPDVMNSYVDRTQHNALYGFISYMADCHSKIIVIIKQPIIFQYLSNAFSIFTTMRIMLGVD